MTTAATIDASAAVRWFVDHPLTPNADRITQLYDIRLAPQMIVGEVGNALWKYVRTGAIALAQAKAALVQLTAEFVTLEQDADHAQRAIQLAEELDHPFYDCLYLAIAEARGVPLITDDQRLLNKLGRERRFKLVALADVS